MHLVSSCVSGIPVSVSKPSLIDIGDAKTVTVLPFLYGKEGLAEDPLDVLFEGYAKYHSTYKWNSSLRRDLSEQLCVAIGKTASENASLQILEGEIIKTMIKSPEPPSVENARQKNGKLKRPAAPKVSRPDAKQEGAAGETEASNPVAEQAASSEAEAEDLTFFQKLALKMGESAFKTKKDDPDPNFNEVWLRAAEFADLAVLGKVTRNSFWMEDFTREGRDDNAKTIIIPVTKKTFELEYTLWVYRLSDGAVLGSADFKQEIVSEKEGSGSYMKVDSDSDMTKAAIDATMPAVSRLFSSYTVRERRVLAKDPTKNARIAEAVKLAKKGEYRAALKLCEAVYAETELYAAGYNAALFAELSGDIEGAVDRMEKLDSTAGTEDTARELARLRVRLAETERL
ncbi:MAG TPA: hypothetical protein PK969_12505 [Treponemataceae bacterium]|nr:hypothetical protein [Treponemataceae bacterium]